MAFRSKVMSICIYCDVFYTREEVEGQTDLNVLNCSKCDNGVG